MSRAQGTQERRSGKRGGTLAALWLASIAAGFYLVWSYALTAGAQGELARTWPEGTRIERARDRPTLVVFVHPSCPCSRATAATLHAVVSDSPGLLDVHVLLRDAVPGLRIPEEIDWDPLRALGIGLELDVGGLEARRFGVATSGDARLYDARGILRFAGGLTPARGHAPDTTSLRALVRLLTRDALLGRAHRERVYGCDLDDPERRAR